MGATFTGNGPEVIARFQATKDIAPARIAAANRRILKRTQERLDFLYGPKLAKKWDLSSFAGSGSLLGSVTVETFAKEVYGYEFGHKAFDVEGKNSPRKMLKFYPASMGLYALIFRRRAHIPQTFGRSRRQSLQASFAFYAYDEWASTLREAIIGSA